LGLLIEITPFFYLTTRPTSEFGLSLEDLVFFPRQERINALDAETESLC